MVPGRRKQKQPHGPTHMIAFGAKRYRGDHCRADFGLHGFADWRAVPVLLGSPVRRVAMSWATTSPGFLPRARAIRATLGRRRVSGLGIRVCPRVLAHRYLSTSLRSAAGASGGPVWDLSPSLVVGALVFNGPRHAELGRSLSAFMAL
jgi:hypothetical protein